jgi:chitodextrinase
VRAADAAGNLSGYSSIATATTAAVADTTPPTIPASLSATASGSSRINLAWAASTDNVGVANYRIERCQGATCTTFVQIASVAGTSYSNTGLAASTAYRYRVRAADAAGNLSGYSTIATATTAAAADTTPPTAPAWLAAAGLSSSAVNLIWAASTDNVGVANYRVERCQGPICTNFVQIAVVTGTTFSNTGLAALTTYRYRVRAADAAGNVSAYSIVSAATTSY